MTSATSSKTDRAQFMIFLENARSGKPEELNQFFRQLYERGKQSLLKLTRSESEAEEVFSAAVAKFWIQFVADGKPLPDHNIEGYIYTMARFHCIDQQRRIARVRVVSDEEARLDNSQRYADTPRVMPSDADELAQLRSQAIQRARRELNENCQRVCVGLFDEGHHKPAALAQFLNLKDKRAATVMKYECLKRLKRAAAKHLEALLHD